MKKNTATIIYFFMVLSIFSVKAQTSEEKAEEIRLEDIEIYAPLKNSTLLTTPQSVEVVQGQQEKRRIEESLHEITNVSFTGGSGRARYFQIRGVGEREQYLGAPSFSTAYLIDDIDFTGIGGVNMPFDIAATEIYKGPQGDIYGVNAFAGLIHTKTKEASFTPEREIFLRMGSGQTFAAGASISGPLSKRWAYRLSFYKEKSAGFFYNEFLNQRTHDIDEIAAKAKLFYQGDRVHLKTTHFYLHARNGYDVWNQDNNDYVTFADKPGRDEQQSHAHALHIDWFINDKLTLENIFTYGHHNVDYAYDEDWGNNPYWLNVPGHNAVYDYHRTHFRERNHFTQEVRLKSEDQHFGKKVNWLVGARFAQLSETGDIDAYQDDGSLYEQADSDYDNLRYSLFSLYDIQLHRKINLALGLRYDQHSIDYTDTTNNLNLSRTDSFFSGRLSLNAYVHEAVMLYQLVAYGNKEGGFNTATTVPGNFREYDAEDMWNFEIGAKWKTPKVRGQIALFYMMRDGQQVDTSYQLDPSNPGTFTHLIDNAAKGRYYGLEFETDYQVLPWLQASMNLGLLKAQFYDFTSDERNIDKREQAHAPEYQLGTTISFGKEKGFFSNIMLSFVDNFYFSSSHDQRSNAYQLTHVDFGYRFKRSELKLWVRNVFNENYAIRGFYFGNNPPNYESELYVHNANPRRFGVDFTMRF